MPDPQSHLRPDNEIFAALRELVLAGENYRRLVAELFDINTTDATALGYLRAEGDLGQTELAEKLGRTTSSVTSLIDRLEASGFVERRSHPDDRRRAVIQLTERGDRMLNISNEAFMEAFAGIDDPERTARELQTLARGLNENAHEMAVRKAADELGHPADGADASSADDAGDERAS